MGAPSGFRTPDPLIKSGRFLVASRCVRLCAVIRWAATLRASGTRPGDRPPKVLDESKAALARRMHTSGEPVSTIAPRSVFLVRRCTGYWASKTTTAEEPPAQGANQRKPIQHQRNSRTTTIAYIRSHETKQRARGKTVKTYAVVYRAKVRTDDGRVVSRLRQETHATKAAAQARVAELNAHRHSHTTDPAEQRKRGQRSLADWSADSLASQRVKVVNGQLKARTLGEYGRLLDC